MRNIEASEWIGNPLLMLIENKEKTGTGLSHFRLRFEQVATGGEEAGAAS
jgi:type IV pilus assembly protein PilN